MAIMLWTALALLVAGAFVFAAAVRTRRLLPPIELAPGEKFPSTPVQRLAGWTLGLAALLTGAAVVIVATAGPQTWWDSDPVRLTVTALLLAGLIAYAAFLARVRAWERDGSGKVDERDTAILARASAGTAGAILTVLAVWMVALTEAYIQTRLVPSYFLYLVFWSCVMASALASLAGVLVAYRRG